MATKPGQCTIGFNKSEKKKRFEIGSSQIKENINFIRDQLIGSKAEGLSAKMN